MFKDFLSDMSDYLTKTCGIVINNDLLLLHLLWADDLILISNTPEGLQLQLDNLERYCAIWQMIVNIIKTKFMAFGTKDENVQVTFNNVVVEKVQEYKYLGTVFSSNGPVFNENVTSVLSSSVRATYKVLSYCKCFGQMPPVLTMKLFNSLVAPIISYGCEIWFPLINQQLKGMIEKFHLKFMKSVLHVKQQTPTIGVMGELGEYPLLLKMSTKIIKYWIIIQNLPDDHIVKNIYKLQLNLHNLGHNTWLSEVKNILAKAELSNLWDSHPSLGVAKHVRRHMELVYRNNWMDEVNDSLRNPKLRTYTLVKLDFSPELYLYINIQKYRVALSRLRLSSHHLAIETGRHAHPVIPAHQRICSKCDLNVVDDEIHFITECSKYQTIRENMFQAIIPILPDLREVSNEEKFVQLMTSEDMTVLLALAKYTHTAWK
jgi:hypothetical protein